MRLEFRILPVTLYGLFWNIIVKFFLVFCLVERRQVGDGLLRQRRPRAAARFSNYTLSSFSARHARSSPALGDSLRQEASWVECLSHSAPKSCQDDPQDDLKPTG